uniref:RNA-directed DNA polymerase, eukaryota n=1 Tax=Tanacetum cinerariifolium TaxID=118510 RepID=A0A699I5C7_TANCI|nr:RNA-directed DNA polymerase, eukaryota [Tanacetum cinerariifolium]
MSKEDLVNRISKSVFATNFPDSFGSRDLWKLCEAYGKVVDVFIPNRKSKEGKRFAFVRFIRVINLDRLIGNLCTIWVGRLHLHANAIRYERPSKTPSPASYSPPSSYARPGFYANVVQDYHAPPKHVTHSFTNPVVVLDDSCNIDHEHSCHAMGKVKDVNSIPNLLSILANEGFLDVKLSYLVFFKLPPMISFVMNDVKGIPMHLWSRNTFLKLGSKWGEALDIKERYDASFARKRLCILTKLSYNILESFKVISKGKIYMARAKELFTWTPEFQAFKHEEVESEDESPIGDNNSHVDHQVSEDDGAGDSDGEGVSETVFGDKPMSPVNSVHMAALRGPFIIPPTGFTPAVSQQENNHRSTPHKENCTDPVTVSDHNPNVQSKVMNFSLASHINESSCGASSFRIPSAMGKGGSILDILDGMIRVGQAMRYDMKGCSKDIERIIALPETETDSISHMDVKFIWRNSNYQFVCSDSVGNSGGILCAWEDSIFKKDSVSVADNFIALYGTWLPKNSKVLILVFYAPQYPVLKRILWNYISGWIAQWHGESIVMGDFNEVRSKEERFGSQFNHSSARDFNNFISLTGLVKIKTEGYSYTWSHPSALKMSKLDRFLVSEGIISNFSAITRVCLDRHLSDHRPILLKEIYSDFGPTPFRLYHSWFRRKGFDAMVIQAWNSFSLSDPNRLVRFKKKLQLLKISIRSWIKECNASQSSVKRGIMEELKAINLSLDSGKSKVRWAIEGDENSKFFHGLINKKCSQLSIRGVFVDGDWITDPKVVKDTFRDHFASRFKRPDGSPVWGCGVNKSPGLDGFTFEFFRRFWNTIGDDFCEAVEGFFKEGYFPKVVTKILANRLATVISGLVSESQSAFVANRNILDGPFILNEVLAWCKRKKKQALIFKADFAKAYDSVCWDYLFDVLQAFGFGPNWRK